MDVVAEVVVVVVAAGVEVEMGVVVVTDFVILSDADEGGDDDGDLSLGVG